ncbi:MAG: AAA family ATPase [Gemmatimonadetes bacterium]|nr:AAA family ATPase [Gemmatimonadota bacterium]
MSDNLVTSQLPSLELITFGAPVVRINGQEPPSDVEWRKHIALLSYLALSPDRTRTRTQIIGMLWPETTDQRARHSLNEAVRRLRVSLGSERIRSTGSGDTLTLSGDGLTVDALEFDRVADSDRERALEYLRGDFLEGFSLPDSEAFEAWLSERRGHYRARGAALLIAGGDDALAALRYDQASELARRAIQVNPFSEPAVDILMRSLALAGDATGALAVHAEFTAAVETELGETPSKQLRDLAERIRSGRWLRVSAHYADLDPPLIGRRDSYHAAFSVIEGGIGAGPRGLAINGDPGSGRTRLLAECAARFALQGGVVVSARPLESDHDTPWSTLRALVRGGLGEDPGVAATSPEQLANLTALAPELAPLTPPHPPQDTAQVSHALADLLRAVGDERPLMIALDDAHFADGHTLEALHHALLSLSEVPVLLVLSSLRDTQSAPRALLRLRGEIGRSIPGKAIRLDPLTDEDLAELVAALETWCNDDEERQRLARRVAFETGGNPFLAVTLLRGLEHAVTIREDIKAWPPRDATLDYPLPITVPDLARVAIVASLTSMEQATRDVVVAASLLDLGVDVELLTAMLGESVSDVETELATLERNHFLTFDGDRYAFAAPLLAQVVRGELMTAGQRRRLRERAIEVLAPRQDLEARLLCVKLLAETRPSRQTAEAAATVAREAKAAGAIRAARRAVAAAERAIRKSAGEDGDFIADLRREITSGPDAG